MTPKVKVSDIYISLFEGLFWDNSQVDDYSSSHKGLPGKKIHEDGDIDGFFLQYQGLLKKRDSSMENSTHLAHSPQ